MEMGEVVLDETLDRRNDSGMLPRLPSVDPFRRGDGPTEPRRGPGVTSLTEVRLGDVGVGSETEGRLSPGQCTCRNSSDSISVTTGTGCGGSTLSGNR